MTNLDSAERGYIKKSCANFFSFQRGATGLKKYLSITMSIIIVNVEQSILSDFAKVASVGIT